MTLATYVLVHGGAHGGWCYGRVAQVLRASGHDVHTPTMTGVGDRSHLLRPDIDLDFHIRDILAVLHYEDLRDVILVGHSYGGMVITGVADRAADRIGHIVYLDAAMPANGESLADIAAPLMDAARRDMRVVDGIELVLFPGTEPMPNYGVTKPDDIAWMTERLTPHPWKCFTQPLAALERGGAVGDPAERHLLHLEPCVPRPGLAGASVGRGPGLGHRHRPRPDDLRTRSGRRVAAPGGGRVTRRRYRPRSESRD